MRSTLVRNNFFDFFKSKEHRIISSAPIVIKNDPSLMFTNAGMNQFKDQFLGNLKPVFKRIANTQKCFRVSGKHNDLEEVGIDTYHHTYFEMLGNWSFGDYFKEEAIFWSWELLTKIYKIDENSLYVTIFEGNKKENLKKDIESYELWKKIVPEERIILGSKKDNFWEMGDKGPCGPCTEIHVDIRPKEQKSLVSGSSLVNKDHPQVIELWNIVFIEFNRISDSKLVPLKQKHVDTGMGLERLCMVLQEKSSNYDTDIFSPLIKKIELITNKIYGSNEIVDKAIRVIADHSRAIFFTIAEGQMPSNTGAGYVIRRILRRAIRYGYTFLDLKDPFIFKLFPTLSKQLSDLFPELNKQLEMVQGVVKEEEKSFLKTLSQGLIIFDDLIKTSNSKILDGDKVFELYDTYGFPKDLTALIGKERGFSIDDAGFDEAMKIQKERSRLASNINYEDWVEVSNMEDSNFVGYDEISSEVKIVKYRKVNSKKSGNYYQLILNKTPFYPEGGGQVGDKGIIKMEDGEEIIINNTIKENNVIMHYSDKMPKKIKGDIIAVVNYENRFSIAQNHSATHLLHQALREILGKHIEQRGSFLNSKMFRFDFSHFSKISNEELILIQDFVNKKINDKINLTENRDVNLQDAIDSGAIGIFGEKYDEKVRTIRFGKSFELCGGTHVKNTSEIWFFKIISESSIASGIRRIEAITGKRVKDYFNNREKTIIEVSNLLKQPQDIIKSIKSLQEENTILKKEVEELNSIRLQIVKKNIKDEFEIVNGIKFISKKVDFSSKLIKDLCFEIGSNEKELFIILANDKDGKAFICCYLSKDIIESMKLNANKIINDLAKFIDGKGGGQVFYATAGGNKISGIEKVFIEAKKIISSNSSL